MLRTMLAVAGLGATLTACDIDITFPPDGPGTWDLSNLCTPSLTTSCGNPWVLVHPQSATMAPGDTLRLHARYFDSRNVEMTNVEFDWIAVDTSAITVSRAGLVTAKRAVPYWVHVTAVATHDRASYALSHIRVVQ